MYWLNLFTWWLYISFILYFYKLNPFNPYIFYNIVVVRDILFVLLNINTKKILKNNNSYISIFKLFMVFLVHYLPLYYLYNVNKKQTNKNKKIKKQNTAVLFYIFLFLIYLIYITNNNFSISYMLDDSVEKIQNTFSEYVYTRYHSYPLFLIIFIIVLFISYKILITKY